jgi:hypothetical protein
MSVQKSFISSNSRELFKIKVLILLSFSLSLSAVAQGPNAPRNSRGEQTVAETTPPTGSFFQGEELFRSFRGFCPSHGEWVDRARTSARNLSDVMVAVKDDPACQSLASSIAQLNGLQRVLSKETLTFADIEYAKKKRERFDILMQLKDANEDPTGNASLISTLESSLRTSQLALGQIETERDVSRDNLRDRLVTQQSVAAVSAVLSQSLAQEECLVKRPEVFAPLVALAGSVGAVAVTGGASLGLAAGVQLLGEAVEFSRQKELSLQIRKLNEASIHESFTCVLEAMSNQWCGAKEALALYRLRTQREDTDGEFYRGVRFLRREAPVFLSWLDEVRSGARPSNPGEADRQKVIFAKEAALLAFLPTAYSILEENKALIPPGGGAEADRQQFELMRSAIRSIRDSGGGRAGNVSGGNPILDVIPGDELPWLLAGLEQAPTTEDANGVLRPLPFFSENFTSFRDGKFPGLVYPLDPEIIEQRVRFVFARGQERLALERSNVLNVDPRDVLWSAEAPTLRGPERGLSPLDALRSIREFIAEMSQASMSSNQQIIYADTKARLDNIEEILEKAVAQVSLNISIASIPDDDSDLLFPPGHSPEFPEPTPDDKVAAEALEAIYAEAYLQHGLAFFSARIRRILRFELHRRVTNPEPGDELDAVTSAKLLASEDILEELESFGNSSPTFVKSSISRSLVNTHTTTQSFAEVFSENLNKALHFYHRMAKQDIDYEPAFKDLCLLLMAVPDWNASKLQGVRISLCDKVQKHSDFANGSSSHKISRSSFFGDYSTGRACQYRNFARQEKILRDYSPRSFRGPKLGPINR